MTAAATTPKAKSTKPAAKAPAKSTAKDASAKAATKPAPTTTPLLTSSTDGMPDPLFVAWKQGARISELVKAHKLSRAEIRRRLLAAAGGKEKFKELRQAGAGGPTAKTALAKANNGATY